MLPNQSQHKIFFLLGSGCFFFSWTSLLPWPGSSGAYTHTHTNADARAHVRFLVHDGTDRDQAGIADIPQTLPKAREPLSRVPFTSYTFFSFSCFFSLATSSSDRARTLSSPFNLSSSTLSLLALARAPLMISLREHTSPFFLGTPSRFG